MLLSVTSHRRCAIQGELVAIDTGNAEQRSRASEQLVFIVAEFDPFTGREIPCAGDGERFAYGSNATGHDTAVVARPLEGRPTAIGIAAMDLDTVKMIFSTPIARLGAGDARIVEPMAGVDARRQFGPIVAIENKERHITCIRRIRVQAFDAHADTRPQRVQTSQFHRVVGLVHLLLDGVGAAFQLRFEIGSFERANLPDDLGAAAGVGTAEGDFAD